ncbi:MAG: transitional endoplasmic reticulum ATPase [Blastocatellia bacterium]
MPIPYKLDHVIEKTLKTPGVREQRALKLLTGLELATDEASFFWPRILDHKWYMSERLGRDVGLRVAAVDYFENVWSENLWTPRRSTSGLRGLFHLIFGEQAVGETSVAAFESALAGTRSLAR